MNKKNTKTVARKRQVKKQSNKKLKKTPKKAAKSLLKVKKVVTKKKTVKSAAKIKIVKIAKSKTKLALKKNPKIIAKKKTKKIIKKIVRKGRGKTYSIFTFGSIPSQQGRILSLAIAIIFAISLVTVQNVTKEAKKIEQPMVAGVAEKRNMVREKEINDLVQGYPIEKMTKYIAKQDPKVAAFLVAIAKKESAWGERKPVLNGEDCYNYWGFRLKSDRMGSGGHTCFDSPEEAVEIVSARINHLVNEEKIDTPKKMVIWKCGYGCDGPASAGSEKWIKDVDYYYKQMIN